MERLKMQESRGIMDGGVPGGQSLRINTRHGRLSSVKEEVCFLGNR